MIDPILITGAARSGTSMVAGIVDLCEAFGGQMRRANPNNPKGMFENAHIVQEIVKPYLRSLGYDPMGQYPLPDISKLMIPQDWRKRFEDVMVKQGYDGGPWFYKGAKMCLIWPVLSYAFPNAKWIIVRRQTSDIADSCCRTGFMRAFKNAQNRKAVGVGTERSGWLWWVEQHEKRFVEMMEAGLNVKIVWPDKLVRGDYTRMYETVEWLGLKWHSGVLNFVDPKLWKARDTKRVKGAMLSG